MKRWRVYLKTFPKGNIVCPPVLGWEICAETVQQGTPTCGRIGMELVLERCPERGKTQNRYNNSPIFLVTT